MKLWVRYAFLTTFIIVGLSIAYIKVEGDVVRENLTANQDEWISTLVNAIAVGVAKDTIDGEKLELENLMQRVVTNDPALVYMYVIDFDGLLLAHTFGQGFPRALMDNLSLVPQKRNVTYMTENGVVREVATPLIEGMKAHLHIGVSQNEISMAIRQANRDMIRVTLVIVVISLVVVLLAGYRISWPLNALAEQIRLFGKGDNNPKMEINTTEPDLRKMASAFKDMVEARIDIERKLKESEARYAYAAKIANLGHWEFDEIKSTFLYCSDDLARIQGFPPGEYMARYINNNNIFSRAHPEDKDRYESTIRNAQMSATGYHVEYRILRPDGTVRYVREHGQPVFDEKGKLIRSKGTIQDVTEHKTAERQLIQSSKLASLGEMATGVAHELNQPLNVIQMSADTMADYLSEGDWTPELMIQQLDKVTSQLERATAIINHMRTFGRDAREEMVPIAVGEIIYNALQFTRKQLEENGISLSLDIPDHCSPILGNAIQLEQVMLNLIANARDAILLKGKSVQEKRISISVSENLRDKILTIVISDTGGGIPESIIDHIFEPFYTTKEIGSGTGIGLSISYGIISSMGGRIDVSSMPAGAEFMITLPTVELESTVALAAM